MYFLFIIFLLDTISSNRTMVEEASKRVDKAQTMVKEASKRVDKAQTMFNEANTRYWQAQDSVIKLQEDVNQLHFLVRDGKERGEDVSGIELRLGKAKSDLKNKERDLKNKERDLKSKEGDLKNKENTLQIQSQILEKAYQSLENAQRILNSPEINSSNNYLFAVIFSINKLHFFFFLFFLIPFHFISFYFNTILTLFVGNDTVVKNLSSNLARLSLGTNYRVIGIVIYRYIYFIY